MHKIIFLLIWIVSFITCVSGMGEIAKKHKLKVGSLEIIIFSLMPYINILGALLVLFSQIEKNQEEK